MAISRVGESERSARARDTATAKMEMFVVKLLQDGLTRKAAIKATYGDARDMWTAMTRFPQLRQLYHDAMRLRADQAADETLEIADSDGDPNALKLRVETRKWYAAVIAPAAYSPHVSVDVQGSISIKDALSAGLANAGLLPGCDQDIIVDAQVVEQSTISVQSASDAQSDSNARPANSVPDIFS